MNNDMPNFAPMGPLTTSPGAPIEPTPVQPLNVPLPADFRGPNVVDDQIRRAPSPAPGVWPAR